MSDERDPRTMLDADRAPEESKTRTWFGVYRGVRFEVKTWPMGPSSYRNEQGWAHYLLINVDKQVPEELREKFWLKPRADLMFGKYLTHDYMDGPTAAIEFHGGITFYEKTSGFEGGDRWVKLGCDYQHLWDDGQRYDVDDVTREAHVSIDSFWDDVCRCKPKARSTWDGNFYEIDEPVEAIADGSGK